MGRVRWPRRLYDVRYERGENHIRESHTNGVEIAHGVPVKKNLREAIGGAKLARW